MKKNTKKQDGLFRSKPFRIVSKQKQAEDIYLFRLEKPAKEKQKLCYKPGEFFQVSVPGYGEAPISVCSCSHDYIEMNIRGVGDVTDQLVKLKKGDRMWLRGPYGNGYPMDELKGNSLIIIGGGTGVAPLRGVLKFIEDHAEDYGQVYTCFGFKQPEEILFKKDMKKWEQMFDHHVSVDKAAKSYKGRVCLVTKLVEELGVDNKNKVALVCGPPIMMKFTIKTLEKMGFNHDQIFLSYERRMKCGTGMCGHCMVSGLYVCKDGPVFRYDRVRGLHE